MIRENELREFCDENGYLSLSSRRSYLISLGLGVIKNGDFMVRQNCFDEYKKANEQIDMILELNSKKKAGRMGTVESPVSSVIREKKDDTIDPDKIDF